MYAYICLLLCCIVTATLVIVVHYICGKKDSTTAFVFLAGLGGMVAATTADVFFSELFALEEIGRVIEVAVLSFLITVCTGVIVAKLNDRGK